MKECPILFSAPMVRAILAGQKTQTRRVVKPPRGWDTQYPHCDPFVMSPAVWWWNGVHERVGVRQESPYGQPGDRLWVREAWALTGWAANEKPAEYKLPEAALRDNLLFRADADGYDDCMQHWRPSIHMPRWASRITLEITGVRVERLQDINEKDALAEGITIEEHHKRGYCAGETRPPAIRAYLELWESINGPGSWDANPWVWAIEFKRIKP